MTCHCHSRPTGTGGTLAAPRFVTADHREPGQENVVNYTHYDYLDLAPGASTARIEAGALDVQAHDKALMFVVTELGVV